MACRARFVVTDVRSNPDYPIFDAPGITVTENLRVRSEAGLTGARYELLPNGTPVWVVAGPVPAADYEWFQVIVPSIDTGAGMPRVGWVAASDHGVEPWLARATVDCPDHASLDVRDLMRLISPARRHEGLACFGSRTVRFQGRLSLSCGGEARPGWKMTPEWLSGNAFTKLLIDDGDSSIVAHPSPDLDLPVACGETAEGRSMIEGHFDDETAPECDATIGGEPIPPDLSPVPAYWCRTTLVIDRLIPVQDPSPSPPPS